VSFRLPARSSRARCCRPPSSTSTSTCTPPRTPLVAIGGSLEKAVENALLLEWLAALHHRASALGIPRVLTDNEQADVITQAMRRDYGTTTSINQEKS